MVLSNERAPQRHTLWPGPQTVASMQQSPGRRGGVPFQNLATACQPLLGSD